MTESGKLSAARELHCLSTLFPITEMVSGMLTDSRFGHRVNAESPIDVTDVGIVICLRVAQFAKALLGMEVVLLAMVATPFPFGLTMHVP